MAKSAQEIIDTIARELRRVDTLREQMYEAQNAVTNAVHESYSPDQGALHGNFLSTDGNSLVMIDKEGCAKIVYIDNVNKEERREVMYGI